MSFSTLLTSVAAFWLLNALHRATGLLGFVCYTTDMELQRNKHSQSNPNINHRLTPKAMQEMRRGKTMPTALTQPNGQAIQNPQHRHHCRAWLDPA
jgi:hypothetical protein